MTAQDNNRIAQPADPHDEAATYPQTTSVSMKGLAYITIGFAALVGLLIATEMLRS